MKAKEYYEKYKDRMASQDRETAEQAIVEFVRDLRQEVVFLFEARKIKRMSALQAAVKEINQKYNAVASRFEKEYGVSPIRRDGFNHYCNEFFQIDK